MDAPVDIDQLKIRLLIVCKAKQKFESIANYLIRRGWETTISASIKDAFKTIAVFKPDFVLVSVNLQTSKIDQLPTVIVQTFKMPTILFSEAMDPKTARAMQTIQSPYKMMGTVSGPSTHRRIKQILQEIHSPKKENADKAKAQSKTQEQGTIVVKGASSETVDPGVIIQKRDLNIQPDGAVDSTSNAKDPDLATLAAQFSETNELAENELAEEKAEQQMEQGIEPDIESDIAQGASPKKLLDLKNENDSKDFIDVIVKVAQECILPIQIASAQPDSYAESTIVAIRSSKTNAYLTVSGLGPIEEELQFSSRFFMRLKERVKDEYDDIEIGKEERIEFEPISTQDKIEGEIEGLQIKNGTGEVLIKLIKETSFESKIKKSGDRSRAEIDPRELVANAAVGVSVYLLLERNDKYYLYLKPKSRIFSKQKLRLIESQSKLFINKNEVEKYLQCLKANKTLETFFDPSKRNKSAA